VVSLEVIAMDVWVLIGGAVVIIAVAFFFWRERKPPVDPEEGLRELLGPRGMAVRNYNVAASEAKHNTEMLEAVTNSASKQRELGNLQEAEKLEAYARTIRTRADPLKNLTDPNQVSFRQALMPELKPYLTQLCKLHATTGGFPSSQATAIGQDIFTKYGHLSMIAVHDALRSALGAAPARDLERQWGGIGEWLG
jgi:hypothetical protein